MNVRTVGPKKRSHFDRPYRDVPALSPFPSNKLLGYYRCVPPGQALGIRKGAFWGRATFIESLRDLHDQHWSAVFK